MPDIIVFLTLILILIVTFIYYYIQKRYSFWSSRNVFHLKPSFPFGNFNSKIFTKAGDTIENLYFELKKSGKRFGGYYLMTLPILMPLDPELYKDILTKNFQNFNSHGFFYDEKNDPMSAHLASLSGAKWKTLRAKFSPAFSSSKIKSMFPIIRKCCADLSSIVNKSDVIEIHDLAERYTTDVICTSAFGTECESLLNPGAEFRLVGRKLVNLSLFDSLRFASNIMAPNILKLFKICAFNPKYTDFFYKIVEETITYREKTNYQRNDLMDLLIQLKQNKNDDGAALTVRQIAAQVLLFYLAGFETSANTISFAMYFLAKNEEIQNKVRSEILSVLKASDGNLDYEVLADMRYTEKVIYETLRLRPAIEMLNRVCTQSFQLPNSELIVEEGTRVVIATRGIHKDPEYYPNPEVFDPERFSEEEKAKRPQFTYFPFGEGPRICLGLKLAMIEMKLALSVFLQNHKYSVNPKTNSKIETVSNGNLMGIKDKIFLDVTKIE